MGTRNTIRANQFLPEYFTIPGYENTNIRIRIEVARIYKQSNQQKIYPRRSEETKSVLSISWPPWNQPIHSNQEKQCHPTPLPAPSLITLSPFSLHLSISHLSNQLQKALTRISCISLALKQPSSVSYPKARIRRDGNRMSILHASLTWWLVIGPKHDDCGKWLARWDWGVVRLGCGRLRWETTILRRTGEWWEGVGLRWRWHSEGN